MLIKITTVREYDVPDGDLTDDEIANLKHADFDQVREIEMTYADRILETEVVSVEVSE